jgi:hypothetical protein
LIAASCLFQGMIEGRLPENRNTTARTARAGKQSRRPAIDHQGGRSRSGLEAEEWET